MISSRVLQVPHLSLFPVTPLESTFDFTHARGSPTRVTKSDTSPSHGAPPPGISVRNPRYTESSPASGFLGVAAALIHDERKDSFDNNTLRTPRRQGRHGRRRPGHARPGSPQGHCQEAAPAL